MSCVRSKSANGAVPPMALGRILGLFQILSNGDQQLRLGQLSDLLRCPPSSLLNILRPLVRNGYLLNTATFYRLGPAAHRMAAGLLSSWDLIAVTRPYLEELAEISCESVYLGVLDRALGVVNYAYAIESSQSVRYALGSDRSRPLYATAAGRVLLASVEKPWLGEYLRAISIREPSSGAITSEQELLVELDRIRRTGVAICLGESDPESAAIAAPVIGIDGRIAAAMAIGAPRGRFESSIGQLKPALIAIAARASGLDAPLTGCRCG